MGVRDRITPHNLRDWVLFVLGVVLILDAVFGNGSLDRVIEITVGLLLIGLIPVADVLDRIFKRPSERPPPDES
jgi:hypothetical protein